MSYSINTDDPTLTERWLQDEFRFCIDTLGLPVDIAERSRVNAARSVFLDSEEEKQQLLEHVSGNRGNLRG